MAENFTVDPKDVQDNKIMAILAYLGILVLVPIFAAKESPFARFHANQGPVLLIASIAYSIVVWIITGVLAVISLRLALIGTLLSLVSFVFVVLAIIGIVNAAKGEAKELPIIGKFSILK
ncbi:MAG: zinc ribbon domain-containing protein, partial [Tannerella sp.]|jgi:uncharacterized membrane protein|nr:zinc ribbon domain-containing protein [Tannerella sp.]